MMSKSRTILIKMLLMGSGIAIALTACRTQGAGTPPPKSHLAVRHRDRANLYIDRVDNRSVMKVEKGSAGSTTFISFLVGWQDSAVSADSKQVLARERYFQYTIQNDWVALVQGDSLYPVFFQEKQSLSKELKEGVLVFEIPAGKQPDTLVYKDSFGSWGTQFFVLNRK